MSKKTMIIMIVSSVMMVAIPALVYVFHKAGKGETASQSTVLFKGDDVNTARQGSGSFEDEKSIRAALKRKNRSLYLHSFKKTKDSSQKGEIYTYGKIQPSYDKNSFHTYILERNDRVSLHLVAQSRTKRGLMLDHISFTFDEDIIEYYPSNTFVRDETKFGIIERGDIVVTSSEQIILSKIASATVTKVRFIGEKEELNIDFSEEDKHAIVRTLSVFNEIK
jgi:signal peptidase I